MAQQPWTRNELLIAFGLYCRLPFGKYHSRNGEVIRAAEAIGRTPSAMAMRLNNFASLDPAHRKRGIKGLGSTGPALEKFWQEVTADWTRTAIQCEQAWAGADLQPADTESSAPAMQAAAESASSINVPQGPTEGFATVKVRVVQGFFRRTVLASYSGRCSVCGIRPEPLLTASHIIPWSQSEARRADPTNGLCLCALHDRAFDQGLIALDDDLRVMVSAKLDVPKPSPLHQEALLGFRGRPLSPPTRYHPDPKALEWHRERVFAG